MIWFVSDTILSETHRNPWSISGNTSKYSFSLCSTVIGLCISCSASSVSGCPSLDAVPNRNSYLISAVAVQRERWILENGMACALVDELACIAEEGHADAIGHVPGGSLLSVGPVSVHWKRCTLDEQEELPEDSVVLASDLRAS